MDIITKRSTDRNEIISLIVISGIYRHHTLRDNLRISFGKTHSLSRLDELTTTHWEVIYCLIECYLIDRDVVITDIPILTNLSTSTSRRTLRRLEGLGLVTTTCDESDNRRYSTKLSDAYHSVIDEFVAEYADGFAGLIQRHDKQERKIAQEALERTREELIESEAQLIQAQKLAKLGHWVWDDINKCLLASSAENARIHGVSVDEFMGDGSIEYIVDRFIHPDDKAAYLATIRKADQNRVSYDTRYRIVRPDGAIHHVREISEPMLDEDGNLTRSVGTTQDITESVEVEIALRESEALLVQAQRLAKLGHWVWDDINDCYLTISKENAVIHGLSIDEFLNDENIAYFDDRFIHPDDKELYRSIVREADQNRIPYDTRHRIIRADGAVRYVREISEPILDQNGTIVRSIGTTQDITDSVEVEIALKNSEALLLQAQKLTTVGHWEWDEIENCLTSCSEEYARIFGVTIDDVMNDRVTYESTLEWIHPDDHERYNAKAVEWVKKANEKGDIDAFEAEYRILRLDGSIRYVLEVTSPEFDEQGKLVRSFGTLQDLTDK